MPRDFLQPSGGPLVPYSLRFRDPVSGKSVRARYIAALAEIIARYRTQPYVARYAEPKITQLKEELPELYTDN